MAWENEANWPEAWDAIVFSPIVRSNGSRIVYVGGWDVCKFYKYNITTNTWTELADPPASFHFPSIAMSPDGTRLAAHTIASNLLYIYTISSNSWATSSAAPQLDGEDVELRPAIWADNDIVWCQVRRGADPRRVKCYKYVVSTDTWTQKDNYVTPSTTHAGTSMSINSAGTILYVGQIGDNDYSGLKYVIETDAYSYFSIGSAYKFYYCADRSAKIWNWDKLTSYWGIRYYDCDTETASDFIFPDDSGRTKTTVLTCGIYGIEDIIAHHRLSEPKNRSYLAPVILPTVQTDPATEVEEETATGNGNITDIGGEDCDKRGIVYGTTSQGAPGNVAPDVSGYDSYEEETGSFGTGAFTGALTDLDPNTTYYVRAYAHNSAGYSYGDEVEFTTLTATPTVITNPATAVGQTTATLNGTLDDDGGEACDCGFEYGETKEYGTETATQSKTTGETFSQEVRGLKSGTVYHFRAVATNSGGPGYGADRTFHTEALSAEAHQALGRGYALGRHGL